MLIVILAAGKGTRMKSDIPKVLFPVADKPMLWYSVDLAKKLSPDKIVVVVGNGAEKVQEAFKDGNITFCVQKEQLGTADAVIAAQKELQGYTGSVLIFYGDMPNLSLETLQTFIKESDPKVPSFISVKSSQPTGYGRVVRSANTDVLKIAEEKDANLSEKKISEINTGIYLCNANILMERLSQVTNNNAQNEYYLTDIIRGGCTVWKAKDESEFHGINDRLQLAAVSKSIWKKRALKHMQDGVSIIDPDTVYISNETTIGQDVIIYPYTFIEGKTSIAKGTVIHHGVRLVDSRIEENCIIKDNTLIEESVVGADSKIGPMAHIRPGSHLAGKNSIGNFVELKKTKLGKGSKANHLTYLGDCAIGKEVNIGCGTITCNYDGFKKYETKIGDGVFVGSDVQFIAPITVGDGAIIAAGSTITKDVEADALAIARATQKNLEGKASAIRGLKGK